MADSGSRAVSAIRLFSYAFFAIALVFAAVAWALDDVFFLALCALTDDGITRGWPS